MPKPATLRSSIKALNTTHQLTQRDLAGLLNASQSSIALAVTGQRHLSTETLLSLGKLNRLLQSKPEERCHINEQHSTECTALLHQLQQEAATLRYQRTTMERKLERLQQRYQAAQTKSAVYQRLLEPDARAELDKKAIQWAQVALTQCEKELAMCSPTKQLPVEQKLWRLQGQLRHTRKRIEQLKTELE